MLTPMSIRQCHINGPLLYNLVREQSSNKVMRWRIKCKSMFLHVDKFSVPLLQLFSHANIDVLEQKVPWT
jgi:ubiquinone biosynthesis protein UbiJ